MKLPILEEGTAYVSRSLFLPKTHVQGAVLRGMLTFGEDSAGEPRVLVEEHPGHFEVPQSALSETQVRALGCPVIDVRPKSFDKVEFYPKDSFQIRDNQVDAWDSLKKADSGILNLSCGKGKTVLGWLKASHEQVPTLVVSPQKAHLDNWLVELNTFFECSHLNIGWVQGKKFDYTGDICLSTVQTLAKRAQDGKLPADFLTRFGLVIYDECHCMAAEFFSRAADVGAGKRLGLSATPNRTDRCEGIFFSHLGKVFFSDVTQDLKPTVYVIDTGVFFTKKEIKAMHDRAGQMNVGLMRNVLAQNSERNRLIDSVIRDCLAQGRKTYVLSHSVDHVKDMNARYPDSTVIHGGTKSDERLDRLHGADLVFATVGVGKEAYNRKDLDTLLLVTPFAARSHSAITYQQSVGRILRELPGKKPPAVFLFMDSDVDLCRGMIYSLISESKRNGYEVKTDWRPRQLI
jgi:superfamily II DNA or RNA helicase